MIRMSPGGKLRRRPPKDSEGSILVNVLMGERAERRRTRVILGTCRVGSWQEDTHLMEGHGLKCEMSCDCNHSKVFVEHLTRCDAVRLTVRARAWESCEPRPTTPRPPPSPSSASLVSLMIPRKTPKGGGLFTAASSTARNSTTTSTDDQRAPVTLNGQTSHSLIASTSRLADSKARRVRESSIESTALDEADFTRPDTTVNKKRKVAPSVSTAGSKDKGKGKKLKQKELNFVPTVPFPPHFVKLEKTFKVSVVTRLFE